MILALIETLKRKAKKKAENPEDDDVFPEPCNKRIEIDPMYEDSPDLADEQNMRKLQERMIQSDVTSSSKDSGSSETDESKQTSEERELEPTLIDLSQMTDIERLQYEVDRIKDALEIEQERRTNLEMVIEEILKSYEVLNTQYCMLRDQVKSHTGNTNAKGASLRRREPLENFKYSPNAVVPLVRVIDSGPPSTKSGEEYQGMFNFETEDIPLILYILVWELRTDDAIYLPAAMPAYIIFMCCRYADFKKDENQMRVLLNSFVRLVKKKVNSRKDDARISALWFSNVHTLNNLLKQYSGFLCYQSSNTKEQNAKCFKTYDVNKYFLLFDRVEREIFMNLLRIMTVDVTNQSASAIFDNDNIAEVICNQYSEKSEYKVESSSNSSSSSAFCDILDTMNDYYDILYFYNIDFKLAQDIFHQIMHSVTATAFNALMDRYELCSRKSATLIKYNIFRLETWLSRRRLNREYEELKTVFRPLKDACNFLQHEKSEEEIRNLGSQYKTLSARQIIRLLELYRPDNHEMENVVGLAEKMTDFLSERMDFRDMNLYMRPNQQFQIDIVYKPSSLRLESIELPAEFGNIPVKRM